jgi:NAD(P)H-dependent FMN reductase
MRSPKILVFAGSTRTASSNARLAALAAKELVLLGKLVESAQHFA